MQSWKHTFKIFLMNPNNLMSQILIKHPAEFPLDHILSLLNKPEVRTFGTLAPSRQLAQYNFTGSVQTRKNKVKLLSPLTRRRLEEDCGAGKEPSPGWIYIYIRGLGYGYGAPVYGNARSSDQSANKLLKYHHPMPKRSPTSFKESAQHRQDTIKRREGEKSIKASEGCSWWQLGWKEGVYSALLSDVWNTCREKSAMQPNNKLNLNPDYMKLE